MRLETLESGKNAQTGQNLYLSLGRFNKKDKDGKCDKQGNIRPFWKGLYP